MEHVVVEKFLFCCFSRSKSSPTNFIASSCGELRKSGIYVEKDIEIEFEAVKVDFLEQHWRTLAETTVMLVE